MSDLLTRDEYVAIAKSLDAPRAPFVDGKFRPGKGDALALAAGNTHPALTCMGIVTGAALAIFKPGVELN